MAFNLNCTAVFHWRASNPSHIEEHLELMALQKEGKIWESCPTPTHWVFEVLVPVSLMPEWIQALCRQNPLNNLD